MAEEPRTIVCHGCRKTFTTWKIVDGWRPVCVECFANLYERGGEERTLAEEPVLIVDEGEAEKLKGEPPPVVVDEPEDIESPVLVETPVPAPVVTPVKELVVPKAEVPVVPTTNCMMPEDSLFMRAPAWKKEWEKSRLAKLAGINPKTIDEIDRQLESSDDERG